MKCPHCRVDFHDGARVAPITEDKEGKWGAVHRVCPNCSRAVIELFCAHSLTYNRGEERWQFSSPVYQRYLSYPKAPSRAPLSPEVPEKYAVDYREACLVLSDSAKASAALSRRCLQHLLRDEYKVKKGNLADEIQQVLDEKRMPSYVLDSLDAIRNIGNFAAHPIKSTASGEVLDVEPGEAEWNLDVLEGLFDFFFVQPAILLKKRAALDAKLASAGKPKMK